MTDHETAAGVGDVKAAVLRELGVCEFREQVSDASMCVCGLPAINHDTYAEQIVLSDHPTIATLLATPAASTDPAPEGGLADLVARLREMAAQEFDQRGPHDARGAAIWDTAAFIAEEWAPAHPAPETPEQVCLRCGHEYANGRCVGRLMGGVSPVLCECADPCHQTPETPEQVQGGGLTADERTVLAEAFGGSSPSPLLTSRVERIIAARESAAATRARAEGAAAERERIAQAIEAVKASHADEGLNIDRYALTYEYAARIARSES